MVVGVVEALIFVVVGGGVIVVIGVGGLTFTACGVSSRAHGSVGGATPVS